MVAQIVKLSCSLDRAWKIMNFKKKAHANRMKFDRDTAILRFDDVTTSNKVNYWSQVIIDNLTHVKECSIFSSEFSFYFIFLSSKTTKLWNLRTSCYSGRRYRRSLLYLRHVLLAGSTKTRQILNLIYSAISRPIWTNFFFNLPIFSRRIQFFYFERDMIRFYSYIDDFRRHYFH